MRVVCDNCGATYKIPERKLVKEVNKATCRKCGHRMLIRRPTTARPSPSLPPSGTDDEATRLTRSPLLPDPSRSNPGVQSSAGDNEWAEEGPTRLAKSPPAEVPDERPTVAMDAAPPPKVPAVSTAPVPAAPPRAAVPAPAPKAAPAPAPVPAPAPAAAAAFDPSRDLGWALAGAFISAGGALALAVNLGDSAVLRGAGLGAALFGALLASLVLLTGRQGRQKASIGISIALALLLAGATAGVIEVIYAGLEGMGSLPAVATRAPAQPVPPPPAREIPADDDAAAFLAEDEPEEPAPVEEEPVEEEPVAVAAAAPAPAPAPAPTRTNDAAREAAVASAASEPPPRREAAPPPPPPPEPEPEPAGRELNTTVVQTMIRSNKAIKKCFFEFKKANGAYPSRVDMRFTVENSGGVSSARVTTRKYRGTDFDVCLGGAFRSIQFPPFDGPSQTMTFPFVL